MVSAPSTPTPPAGGPSDGPILALHRGDDGYVCFHSHDGKKRELFAVRAGDLRGMFPELRRYLTRDSYFSINGFFGKGLTRSGVAPHLFRVHRRQDNLRYLNACFIDLDGYDL